MTEQIASFAARTWAAVDSAARTIISSSFSRLSPLADALADKAEAIAQPLDLGDEIGRIGIDRCGCVQAVLSLFWRGMAPTLMQKTDRGNSSPATAPAIAPGAASAGQPRAIELGDLDMRIARDGTWFYRGSPINRAALVKLFASVLRRDEDGSYWLVTPAERGRVVVEDAPFIAVELDAAGEGRDRRLIFRTNLDEIVTAGPDHPLRVETSEDGTPAPYILVRPGLEARLARSVFYELVELAEADTPPEAGLFGVWSAGQFFELGDPGEDEES